MMERMTTDALHDRVRPDPAALMRLLERCNAVMQRLLPPLLDGTFQHIDEALHDLADKAESDRLNTAYYEALRLVRRERANLKRRCLRNIADTTALFQGELRSDAMVDDSNRNDADETSQGRAQPEVANPDDIDSEALELVADKDLEESLVLTNLVSKAESRYFQPLQDLTRHMATLLGGRSLRPRDTPISPTAICDAFVASVKSVPDIEPSTLLVMYKVFDKQVMDNLDEIYRACIEFSVSQGLVPSTGKHRIINRASYRHPASGAGRLPSTPSAHASEPAPAPSEVQSPTPDDAAPRADRLQPGAAARNARLSLDAGNTSPERLHLEAGLRNAVPRVSSGSVRGPASVGQAPPSFEQLRVLLHGRRGEIEPLQAVLVVDTDELMAALSRVQRHTEPRLPETLMPGDLRHALVDALQVADKGAAVAAGAAKRRLTRTDEDAMDLVFLLFEQVLAAPDVPDPIKAVISRLQIPYVRVAIIDPGFFEDCNHPARRLLNRIAEASIGWNEDGDRGQDDLYERIVSVVERVVTEFHADPDLFERLDAEFAGHVSDQQRQARLAELRTVRSIGARSERHAARRMVMRLIDERLKARAEIPVVVAAIIYDGWVEVLLDAYAREGENGDAWRHALRVLDRLIWSIQPKRDPAERRELLRRIPELLRDLRTALSVVVSDPQMVGRWLKELQVVHIAVLRGPVGKADSSLGSVPVKQTPADDAMIDVNALPVGSWLAIMRDDDQWFRAKLAWRSDDGDEMLFVDRLGRKGFEMTRQDLETLFEQELAEVIGDGNTPLVDRAMEAVRQSLTLH